MWPSSKTTVKKQAKSLDQPLAGNLIRELRQLAQLTQEQLAGVLGVAYGTINRWENGRVQPSPLALRQIRGVLDELRDSPEEAVREGSEKLLCKYFANDEQNL